MELRVADTGQGLTPEECERLFTPYYTTKQHGTGLGWRLCSRWSPTTQVPLRWRAARDSGATFIITLPRAEA